jgi:hypothetical protein
MSPFADLLNFLSVADAIALASEDCTSMTSFVLSLYSAFPDTMVSAAGAILAAAGRLSALQTTVECVIRAQIFAHFATSSCSKIIRNKFRHRDAQSSIAHLLPNGEPALDVLLDANDFVRLLAEENCISLDDLMNIWEMGLKTDQAH